MKNNINKSKAKSARKPLKQINNGGRSLSKQPKHQHQHQHQHQHSDENVVDRLLLVHSDLSTLFQQIDELVVNAVKVEGASKKGKEEIDVFTNVLSDMQSSLKSWIPRFQNVLTNSSVESGNQQEQSSPTKTFFAVTEETRTADDSPAQSDLDSFVSPSPLVSWCPERTVESGRQLFLLTPLPRSRLQSSKLRCLSRSITSKNMDDPLNINLKVPSLLTDCPDISDGLLGGEDMKSLQNKCSKSSVSGAESSLDFDFVSPPMFSNRNRSMFLMTPRLKMSPPKSCVLLEPIVEFSQQDNNYIPKKTPFPVRTQPRTATPYYNQYSESLTLKYSETWGAQQDNYNIPQKTPFSLRTHPRTATPYYNQYSENLTLKYSETSGAQQANKSRMGRKEVDASVDCLLSPFKSCVLMEPSDRNLTMNLAIDGDKSSKGYLLCEQTKTPAAAPNKLREEYQSAKQTFNQELNATPYPVCTPIWKESGSRINTGRQPGENTLKKELWTKFEAATSSSNALRLGAAVFQDTPRKGFLDRLEEVSCDEMSSEPNGLR